MRQSLVSVLLLASVAISSSKVLPIQPINELKTEPFELDGQENDNILSNKFQTRNILNDVFYKVCTGEHDRKGLQDLLQRIYVDTDNKPEDNPVDQNVDYNGNRFRTEQWHNYRRQLDRLHEYLHEYHNIDKRNLDPDDPVRDYVEEAALETDDERPDDFKANKLLDDPDTSNIYPEVVAASTPLLILKLRLACLNNNIDVNQKLNLITSELNANNINKEEQIFNNELNPAMNLMKVKRESITNLQYGDEPQNPDEKTTVKKRMFSFWSRLQGLNHKGHQLQHRRHLYALYGLPDADKTGVLTAETRATLMRPPGSPLRWG